MILRASIFNEGKYASISDTGDDNRILEGNTEEYNEELHKALDILVTAVKEEQNGKESKVQGKRVNISQGD